MNVKTVLFLITTFFAFVISCFAQERFTISGTITDSKSNETLIGVSISVSGSKIKATTNEYGFYSISLPKGSYKLDASYIGFQTKEIDVTLSKNTKLNIS